MALACPFLDDVRVTVSTGGLPGVGEGLVPVDGQRGSPVVPEYSEVVRNEQGPDHQEGGNAGDKQTCHTKDVSDVAKTTTHAFPPRRSL
jgi:hypothetical protein